MGRWLSLSETHEEIAMSGERVTVVEMKDLEIGQG
jgi:hypothetical protein